MNYENTLLKSNLDINFNYFEIYIDDNHLETLFHILGDFYLLNKLFTFITKMQKHQEEQEIFKSKPKFFMPKKINYSIKKLFLNVLVYDAENNFFQILKSLNFSRNFELTIEEMNFNLTQKRKLNVYFFFSFLKNKKIF